MTYFNMLDIIQNDREKGVTAGRSKKFNMLDIVKTTREMRQYDDGKALMGMVDAYLKTDSWKDPNDTQWYLDKINENQLKIQKYKSFLDQTDLFGTKEKEEQKAVYDNLERDYSNASALMQKSKNYWSQWDSKEAYEESKAAAQEAQRLSSIDRPALEKQIDQLKAQIQQYENDKYFQGVKKTRDNPQLMDFQKESIIPAKGKELLKQYDSWQSQLSQLTNDLKQSEKLEKLTAFEKLRQNADFAEVASNVKSKGYNWLGRRKDPIYEYINDIDNARNKMQSEAAIYAMDTPGGTKDDIPEVKKALDYISDEEKDLYNYLYNKKGKETADEYIDLLLETIAYRKANKEFEEIKGNRFYELFSAINADQYVSGAKNIFSKEAAPLTAREILSSYVSDDLENFGPQFLGKSLGQRAYEAINSLSNMAPSVALGASLGAAGIPGATLIASATMGASAGGGAKMEALRDGYTLDQANSYGLLVGASEATLQYLLGGISKLGGAATKGIGKAAISKIDSVLGKIAVNFAIDMSGEFTEEYLQEILNPVFRNICLDENNEFKVFTEDALFSGIVGALSAGILSAGGTVSDVRRLSNIGKTAKTQNLVTEMQKLGSLLDPQSTAAKMTQKLTDKTSNLQIGGTLGSTIEALSKEVHSNTKSAVESRMRELGASKDIAEGLSDVVIKFANHEKLSPKEENWYLPNIEAHQVANELRNHQINGEQTALLRNIEKRFEDLNRTEAAEAEATEENQSFTQQQRADIMEAERGENNGGQQDAGRTDYGSAAVRVPESDPGEGQGNGFSGSQPVNFDADNSGSPGTGRPAGTVYRGNTAVDGGEGNSNAEVLGGRGVSAVGGGDNHLRQSGKNSRKMAEYLGVLRGNDRTGQMHQGGLCGWLETRDRNEGAQRSGLRQSTLGDLSGKRIKTQDSVGRQLSPELQERLADTALKDSDGTILSLYHWTNAKFDRFEKGDVGFHFGTLEAANTRRNQKAVNNETGYYKEAYLNIKSPVLIEEDRYTWDTFVVAEMLRRQGIFSASDIAALEKLDGYYAGKYNSEAAIALRKLIRKKGYDGIVYTNGFEGDYSVIAFDPEQIITVAENGILKENSGVREGAVGDSASTGIPSDNRLSETDLTVNEERRSEESAAEKANKYKAAPVNHNIIELIDKVEEGNYKANEKVYFSNVSDDIAKVIFDLTGIDVTGFKVAIEARQIDHILLDHGQYGRSDHSLGNSTDIAKMEYVLSNPDTINNAGKTQAYSYMKNGQNKTADTILYEKSIGNQSYYVVQAVADTKAKTLFVVSAFIGKPGYKNKQGAAQLINAKSPDATPKSGSVVAPDNSISETAANVNQEEVNREIQYEKPAEFWTAAGENESNIEETPSLGSITSKIEKLFNLPISTGKFKERAYGIYKTNTEAIRTRVANNITTISHELGHHLDKQNGLTQLPEIEEAISVLKKDRPDFVKSYKEKQIPGEAVAEFVRNYITDRNSAKSRYPQFYKAFAKALNYRKGRAGATELQKLDQIADLTNKYMTASQYERIKASVETRAEARKNRRRIPSFTESLRKFREKIQDDSVGLKQFSEEAYEEYSYGQKSNSRIAATLKTGYMTALDGGIVYQRDSDGNVIKDESGNPVPMPSLYHVLDGLKRGKEYEDFEIYLICKHGAEWVGEGKRVFADDTLNNVDFLEKTARDLEKKYPHFQEIAEGLYQWQKVFMEEWLVKGGIITRELFEKLNSKYKYYVPFQRDTGSVQRGVKSSIANQRSPIKRAFGSGLDILNPIESIMLNVDKFIKVADRNSVMQQIAKDVKSKEGLGYLLEEVPPDMKATTVNVESQKNAVIDFLNNEIGLSKETVDAFEEVLNTFIGSDITNWGFKDYQGRDIVWVLNDGKKTFYQVHDKGVLDALTGLNNQQLGKLAKVFAPITRMMKVLTTGANLIFALRSNMVRDFDAAFKFSEENNFFRYTKDYIKAIWQIIRNSEEYKAYRTAGGGYNSSISTNPRTLEILSREIRKPERTAFQKFWENKFILFEKIEQINDVVESASRLAEFNRVLKRTGNRKAALRASDEITVNFNRHGSWGREIDAIIPYFNASVQGIYRMAWEFKHNPIRFTAKAMTMAAITTAIQFFLNHLAGNDDEYEKLSSYKKNNFYNISFQGMEKGQFISIPKSKETAVFNSLMERIVELAMKEDKDFAKEVYDFGDYFFSLFAPPGVPTPYNLAAPINDLSVIGTAAEIIGNRDFKGAPIVPGAYQDLLTEDQYDERTTWISKQLGKFTSLMGLSPMQLDHIITSNFGIVGDLLEATTAEEKDWTLGFKNALVADAAYSNDTLNEFYDKANRLEKVTKSKPEDAESMSEYKQYKSARSVVSALNQYGKEETEEARLYKIAARDYVIDFEKNQADSTDSRLLGLYSRTNDASVFNGKTFKREIRVNNETYVLSAGEFLQYVDDYNNQLREAYDEILSLSVSDETTVEMLNDAQREVAKALNAEYAGVDNSTISDYQLSQDTGIDYGKMLLIREQADKDGNGYVSQSEYAEAARKSELLQNDIQLLIYANKINNQKKEKRKEMYENVLERYGK